MTPWLSSHVVTVIAFGLLMGVLFQSVAADPCEAHRLEDSLAILKNDQCIKFEAKHFHLHTSDLMPFADALASNQVVRNLRLKVNSSPVQICRVRMITCHKKSDV